VGLGESGAVWLHVSAAGTAAAAAAAVGASMTLICNQHTPASNCICYGYNVRSDTPSGPQ
jgi:hypothetical protein